MASPKISRSKIILLRFISILATKLVILKAYIEVFITIFLFCFAVIIKVGIALRSYFTFEK